MTLVHRWPLRTALVRCPSALLVGSVACALACACGSGGGTTALPSDGASAAAPVIDNDLGIPPLLTGDQAESARSGRALQMELVSSSPEQQRRGYNALTVRFSDLSGAPYEPAVASAVPWMPGHGHGTAVAASVHPGPNSGEWVLDNLNLFMASYWKVYVFVCASAEEPCCDASTEPCDETSESLVDTLFFKVWIPS